MQRVYFDNAATTAISPKVVEVMQQAMQTLHGNPSSIHTEGREVRAAIEGARKTVASLLNASTAEIFFTSGGTESNNTAIKCAVRDLGVTRIISSKIEHHCGLHAFECVQEHNNVELVYLPVNDRGQVSMDALEAALTQPCNGKTLVSLMHANNEIGTLLDMEAVSALCQEHGAYFHSDTVQTIGHLPIDLSKTVIHFISAGAHKFHGPKGVGFLYVNGDVNIKPFIDGGSQERNMRGGTENVYGILGMAKALELACGKMEEKMAHIDGLRSYMKKSLAAAIPDIHFHGDVPNMYLPTVLSVCFPPNPKSEMFLLLLDMNGIAASGGSACSSGAEKGSHVLAAIGAETNRKVIRFSFSHNNSEEEVDFVVEKVKTIIGVPIPVGT